jgi:hypothetical protein
VLTRAGKQARRPLNQVSTDLLALVIGHLESWADMLHFEGVCRNWRAAALSCSERWRVLCAREYPVTIVLAQYSDRTWKQLFRQQVLADKRAEAPYLKRTHWSTVCSSAKPDTTDFMLGIELHGRGTCLTSSIQDLEHASELCRLHSPRLIPGARSSRGP